MFFDNIQSVSILILWYNGNAQKAWERRWQGTLHGPDKVKDKIRQMWKSLAFRLLYVVCMTFLPLNIMAIVVSGMVIWKSSEEVLYSYQRELSSSMTRFVSDLEKVDEYRDSFVLDYLTELTLADAGDNMISYQMIDDLGNIFSGSHIKGIFYLYDRMEDRLFLKYTKKAYSILEVEEMKRQLLQKGIPEGTNTTWELYRLEDRFFYIKHYEYTNYCVGFLADMNESLREAVGEELTEEKKAFFTDGSHIIRLKEDCLTEETQLSWFDLSRDKLLYQWVEWDAGSFGCKVGLQISRGNFLESIPVFYWILLVAALLCVLLIFTLWRLLQRRVVKPISILRCAMKQLEDEHLSYRIENHDRDETEDFLYLYDAFNHMAEEIKLSHEKDIKMYQAQLDNLRLQVNPHMLLNSFNMIYSLAQTKNFECIQEFSMHLVEYFRYALKESNTFVTLKKEMKFVENYIEIQKIRFPGAFSSVYSMPRDAEEALVPPLLIQNFVENAMKYALIPGKVIEVLINIRREEERLLVSVCDTGRGIRQDVLDNLQKGEMYVDKMGQKHIGIWNCRRRMEVFYGESASMNIVSRIGEGTQVWLDLPYMEEAPDESMGRRRMER